MNVAITGATGFLGRAITQSLLEDGHAVRRIVRRAALPGDFETGAAGEIPEQALDGVDAVIHLAGEPVAQRWTAEARQRIRASRLDGTWRLVEALSTQAHRPEVLISGSAVGFYGDCGEEEVAEDAERGYDFLAKLAVEWESAADLAQALGIRVVKLRTGIVLGAEGGALAKMLPPFRWGVGGRLGNGRQWMPWIALDDFVSLVRFALAPGSIAGVVNATAPNPVRNAEFSSTLARVLGRPAIFPVPGFVLKALLGDMAQMLLGGQKVMPRAALAAGFTFAQPHLEGALRQALAGSRSG
ncbi:MAG: TIGR01777 family protein [Acidobacteria bacterium]|nr:TIGR01777 family protein [Acidobacteriota bacterium]